MGRWLPVIGLLVLAYAAICAFVFFRQRQMLYFPAHVSEAVLASEARAVGLSRWLNAEGQPIGWTAAGDASIPPILICHGNAGHAVDRIDIVRRLRAAGIGAAFFILDYPGFGSRAGTLSEESLSAAAVEALRSLPSPAIVFGESLGAGVAAQAASHAPERVRGLILLTPFDSVVGAAAHHYPWLPVRFLVLDRFDSIRALRDFRAPIAVIIAEKDDTTPPEGGQRLFNSLTGPKKLWLVPGAGHNGTLDGLSDAQWLDIWQFVTSQQ